MPGPAVLDLPETTATLPNDFSGSCGPNDQVSLTDALRISCNTAFASIGLDLGADALKEQADKFGFDQALQIPLNVAISVFPSDLNAPQTAQAAIGQFDVRATAMQMAMVAAGVANNGAVMRPYLVEQARGPDLAVLSNAKPEVLSQAVTPQVAQQLQDMMKVVVDSGTVATPRSTVSSLAARPARRRRRRSAPLAWFISFARDGDRTIATATVIEARAPATTCRVAALRRPFSRGDGSGARFMTRSSIASLATARSSAIATPCAIASRAAAWVRCGGQSTTCSRAT